MEGAVDAEVVASGGGEDAWRDDCIVVDGGEVDVVG